MVGRLRRKIIGFLSLALLGFLGLMSMQSLGKKKQGSILHMWSCRGLIAVVHAAGGFADANKTTLQ